MKERVDVLLVQKGFVSSRSQARDLIKLKRVLVNGKICEKPGEVVSDDSNIQLLKPRHYVSRGAEKLEKAYLAFGIDFKDKVVCDIGASKGGFTQFALEHGARKVYAIDVGSNQLADSLRSDSRVISLEHFNARYLSPDKIGEQVDIVLCDVSFISVRLLLKAINSVLKESGVALFLIKPQFETGRFVAQSKECHNKVIAEVFDDSALQGLFACDLTYSPITGSDGNIEYLAYFSKSRPNETLDNERIVRVVEQAWSVFRGEQ